MVRRDALDAQLVTGLGIGHGLMQQLLRDAQAEDRTLTR
jgi:hypothetical protein